MNMHCAYMKVAESDIYGQNWAACQVTAISLRCAGLNMANSEDDFDATEAEVKGQLLLLIDIIVCATFFQPDHRCIMALHCRRRIFE